MSNRILPLLLLSSVAAAQREDELMVHWRFDQASLEGGSFYAVFGQPPLRPTGATKFLGEGEQQALVLPEKGGYLQSAGRLPSDVLPQRLMSVEGWVAVDQAAPWGSFLCAIEDNGDDEAGWMLGIRNDRLCFGLATQAHPRLHYLSSPRPFQSGRWYHVAGVYDGVVQRLYVDGVEVAEFAEHGGEVLYKRDHLLAAGAFKDSNEVHQIVGGLYELRLWNKDLSEADLERRVKKMRSLMPAPAEAGSVTGLKQPAPPSVRALQPAINEAIDRGVAWLLARQHRDGSWETHQDGYPNGGTSLALYTLVKQGIPVTHPAIQNGLRYLRAHPPQKTYSAGCNLLLLAALAGQMEEEVLQAWAAEILDLLIDWEKGNLPGAYGYPGGGPDLSNIQYAALGLWAAHKLGVKTPKDLWQRLIQNALEFHQTAIEELEWEGADAGSRSGKRKVAGFTYRGDPSGEPTGSMTAAGLCIIGTAREAYGEKLGRKVFGPAQQSERMAFEWLSQNWSVDRSPGGGQHLYYLYGIERVGALYQTEMIGKQAWYPLGAEKLVKMQKGGGEWGGEHDTCFALLFLSRATASATGPGVNSRPKGWESKGGKVEFYATGDETLAMWVTGFEEALVNRRKEQASDRAGLRIIKVEYLVDGEVVATAKGNPNKAWEGDRFAARYTFPTLGKHTVRARAHAVAFGDPIENHGQLEILESKPIEVDVLLSPQTFQRRHLVEDDPKRSRLELDVSLVSASSEGNDKTLTADRVLDNRHATRWQPNNDDAFPWVRIELREPARAQALRISPAASALHLVGSFEVITQCTVLVNGEDSYQVTLPADGLTWGELEFDRPQKIRSLEVRLDGRRETGKQAVGLAEIELLGEPPRRSRRR